MSSGVASAAHFPGHGLDTQPSREKISTFCKQYPGLIDSPNYSDKDKQQYRKLYQQHCHRPAVAPVKPPQSDKPAIKPGTKTEMRRARIDRIQPPACLAQGSEIHVRGENLRDGRLDCRLEAGGQRQSLQAYSRTAREYRFRLGHLQPGPDYMLQCDVDGVRERISLQGCAAPGPAAEFADVDLAAEIRAGALRPGETQMVEVSIPNRGRSRAPQNQRYRVLLALVDRNLTRTAGMAMGGRETLVEKRQWLTRVPAGGQSERVSVSMNIPGLLPAGQTLHWCAFADVDRQIPEANRRNNLACVPASGDQQTVARDDLSKLFGSAVRGKDIGARVPDADLTGGQLDEPLGTRQYIADEDAEQPSLASDSSSSDRQDLPAVQDRVMELPAVQDRVADLSATQRDVAELPAIQADPALSGGDLGGRAGVIEQANQARGIGEVAELMRDGLAVPGIESGEQNPLNPGGFDIANRDTGNPLDNFRTRPGQEDTDGPFGANPYMPEPTAPRNQEGSTPNAGRGANPFIPSMNPRDWASGASSNHVAPALGSKLPGRVETVRTSDYTERTHTWTDSNGWHQVVDTFRNDGTSSRNDMHVTETGTTTSHTEYDENGTVTERVVTLPEEVPESTQDPNSPNYSHEFARWHSQFDHSKKQGAPVIDQVNPGPEGATPNPKGPRLRVPEYQLVGNPSPETLSGDERQAQHSREQLLEKIRGPGGHPGDDDGDLEMPGN